MLEMFTHTEAKRIQAIADTFENGNITDALDTLASTDRHPAPASFGAGEARVASTAIAVFAVLGELVGSEAANSFARAIAAKSDETPVRCSHCGEADNRRGAHGTGAGRCGGRIV